MKSLLVLLVALLMWPVSAVADDAHVGADDPENSWNVTVSSQSGTQTSPTQAVASTATQVTYELTPACEEGGGTRGDFHYGCGGQDVCAERGELYNVWAFYPDGTNAIVETYCLRPSQVPATVTVSGADVLRAFRRIPLPASNVVIQPPGGETLVNFDTVFSTDADSFTRTIGLLGHRVELRIEATRFDWVNGDGTGQSTNWQGRKWTRGAAIGSLITHRYDDAEKGLRPRVDTTWSATYRVDGGAWRDVPGTVTMTGAAYDLTVLSASPALAG